MANAKLEHANITVKDAKQTADMLGRIFDWHVRWSGASMDDGTTYHVGTVDQYLAVYNNDEGHASDRSYRIFGNLNHFGILVDDLDLIETRVKAEGFKPHNYGDYEPGRRFYFHDNDGIEYEVVSYASP